MNNMKICITALIVLLLVGCGESRQQQRLRLSTLSMELGYSCKEAGETLEECQDAVNRAILGSL